MVWRGRNYLFSYENQFVLIYTVLNVYLMCIGINKDEKIDEESYQKQITIIPSISCFFMVFEGFYWMTLFEQTSFWVTLLKESIYDIRYFIFLLLLCVVAFSNAILISDFNNEKINSHLIAKHDPSTEEYESLTQTKFDKLFIDSIMTQYLLGLGEFETDAFED